MALTLHFGKGTVVVASSDVVAAVGCYGNIAAEGGCHGDGLVGVEVDAGFDDTVVEDTLQALQGAAAVAAAPDLKYCTRGHHPVDDPQESENPTNKKLLLHSHNQKNKNSIT